MANLLLALSERARFAADFFAQRERHPEVPVLHLFNYLRGDGGGESLEEYVCNVTRGHRFAFTGTAYGGDDERWGGEGRSYCAYCGADGDA